MLFSSTTTSYIYIKYVIKYVIVYVINNYFIFIIFISEAAVRRLRRAGANHVISPLQIGGARAAMSILRPTVVDFLELSSPLQGEEVDLEELVVQPGSPAAGKAVADLEEGHPRLRIVAVRHAAEPIQIMPEREARVAAGDQLVVIGLREDLVGRRMA